MSDDHSEAAMPPASPARSGGKAKELHVHPQQKLSDTPTGYSIKLLSGSAHPQLAKEIGEYLGVKVEPTDVGVFSDGETNIHIKNNIRGSDVFLIQPTCPPDVNRALVELLLFVHTLRLSSPSRITVVMPYYGYARQDRKTRPRTPISASAVAQLIEAMAPTRVVTVDLHCGQIQGFFHRTPVDNLYADIEFIEWIKSKNFDVARLTIVSPDAGGVARARRVADLVGASSVVTIIKRRVQANQVDSMQVVGDVAGKVCIIVDDMIDTAGTICAAAQMIRDQGATQVFACASHGILSGPACERLEKSVIEEVVVTNTIPQTEHVERCSKLVVLSIVELLGEAIRRLHEERSLSVLFQDQALANP